MAIGIFPGTFDPVHEGHIAFALAVARDCGLDEVIFVPEHSPRGKTNVSTLPERITRIEKQIKTHPNLRVAELESRQFTVAETLPELRRLFDGELTLLIGSDVAAKLHLWPDLDQLLGEVRLAIGLRGEHTADEVRQTLSKLKAGGAIIETPHKQLSSSQIRLKLSRAPVL